MNILDGWRERRQITAINHWDREHRWDALAKYNAERSRGLVHTPEYDDWMRSEQARFDWEMADWDPRRAGI